MTGLRKILGRTLLSLILVGLITVPALAALDAVGPTSAQNGFPVWYSDSNGLAVEICLDGDGATGKCLYDPVITDPLDPSFVFSQQIGFGAEGFWWSADAGLDLDGLGNRAVLVLGLEAAFANENPVDGDQFAFGRLRIRVDAPFDGTYTVTHPYGVDVFENVVAGPNAINVTSDIGSFSPDFNGALGSDIGPLLTWPGYQTDPALVDPITGNPQYVGDPQTPHVVTGSPFGTNIFRVQGPNGLDVQTNLFSIQGKLFTGTVPTPVKVQRTTFNRSALGQMDVFVTSTPTANVSLTSGVLFPTPVPLDSDGLGNFFATLPLRSGSVVPALVTLTADNSGTNPQNTPTAIISPLTDVVTVTRANYDPVADTLEVLAFSSDKALPPTLTVPGFGNLTAGALTVNNLTVPPAAITVVSSAGGTTSRSVKVVPSEIILAGGVSRYFITRDLWQISGKIKNAAPGTTVTAYLGNAPGGTVIGSAVVDSAAGNSFLIRTIGSGIAPAPSENISLASDNGIVQLAIPVTLVP